MKIYTKTGDQGQTGLLGGDRVDKDSIRIEAIGSVDELNAYCGVCIATLRLSDVPFKQLKIDKLTRIQNCLFDVGSELACPPGGKFDLISVSIEHIEMLEHEIDEMDEELEPLRAFILPGGSLEAAHMHFFRTLCRRTERQVLALHRINPIRNELIMYVNRLSDWIFCFSRLLNLHSKVEEQKWSKGVK